MITTPVGIPPVNSAPVDSTPSAHGAPAAGGWVGAFPEARLLVVDDEQRNLDLMGRVLRRAGYANVVLTADPVWALDRIGQSRPDLIVMDLHMPGIDGLEMLRRLQTTLSADEAIPRLVVTADATTETRRTALALGAHDFLTKPIDVTEVHLRVSNLLQTRMLHVRLRDSNDGLEDQIRARTRQLEQAHHDVTRRLALVGEYRDDDTAEHTARVAALAEQLALGAGLSAEQSVLLGQAALLHDIGKVAIPDAILFKPGPLTPAELSVVRTHPVVGAHILAGSMSPMMRLAEQIARSHHERWDGTGYPDGLAGAEIPFAGRLVAIVDVYDSMSSARSYKPAWDHSAVVVAMSRLSGSHFDPALLAVFLGSLSSPVH